MEEQQLVSARAKEEAARIVATGAAPQTRSQLRAQRRGTLLVASIHPRSVAALPPFPMRGAEAERQGGA